VQQETTDMPTTTPTTITWYFYFLFRRRRRDADFDDYHDFQDQDLVIPGIQRC